MVLKCINWKLGDFQRHVYCIMYYQWQRNDSRTIRRARVEGCYIILTCNGEMDVAFSGLQVSVGM